jgi:hypothetical protein
VYGEVLIIQNKQAHHSVAYEEIADRRIRQHRISKATVAVSIVLLMNTWRDIECRSDGCQAIKAGYTHSSIGRTISVRFTSHQVVEYKV